MPRNISFLRPYTYLHYKINHFIKENYKNNADDLFLFLVNEYFLIMILVYSILFILYIQYSKANISILILVRFLFGHNFLSFEYIKLKNKKLILIFFFLI